jgi:hypothetical protein
MPAGFAMVALVVVWAAASPPALDGSRAPALSYDRDVQPILRKRCAGCHNAERPRGDLDMTTYAGLTAGGTSGKAAVRPA